MALTRKEWRGEEEISHTHTHTLLDKAHEHTQTEMLVVGAHG